MRSSSRRSSGSRRRRANGLRGCTSTIRTRPTPPRLNGRRASRPIRTSAKSRGLTRRSAPLFDRLARHERPTLVVVTADHGEALGEHGEATHGIFAYESTLRVPMIFGETRGRGQRRRRRPRRDPPARHIDILPTVLDALGVSAVIRSGVVTRSASRVPRPVLTGRPISKP